jgi:transposase-like protein
MSFRWSSPQIRGLCATRAAELGSAKERNVLDHLPEAERPLVQRRLRAAWALTDADQATTELEQLAHSLDRQRPGAAASLREGLELTLTVTRLGVGGKLLQTVESTNPMWVL